MPQPQLKIFLVWFRKDHEQWKHEDPVTTVEERDAQVEQAHILGYTTYVTTTIARGPG